MPKLIHCLDGYFEFYVAEYLYAYTGKPASNVLFRCPEGQSPASRIFQLNREGKLKQGWEWSRIREATETEIQWWKKRHGEEVDLCQ